jgi:mannose-6-phosphate isomerase-like protein (cupin superfamily)
MRTYKLKNFIKGWIVGNFEPNIVRTKKFEFCVKNYKKGESDTPHIHKKAIEISAVVDGTFRMNGKVLRGGDITYLKKGEKNREFVCLKKGSIAVIKLPSVKNDKYLI